MGGEGDHPGPLHGEDAPQARDEGGQAWDLRENGGGQGQACQDHCEGLLRGRPEEERLNLSCMLGVPSLCRLAVPSGRPAGTAPAEGLAMCRNQGDWMYVEVASV